MLPNCDGISLEIELHPSDSPLSAGKLHNCGGIGPVRLFSRRLMSVSVCIFARASGMLPDSPAQLRSITRMVALWKVDGWSRSCTI